MTGLIALFLFAAFLLEWTFFVESWPLEKEWSWDNKWHLWRVR